MSYATLLINWCTIQTYTAGIVDGYGREAKDWPVLTDPDVPCRLMATGGTELHIGAEVVIADYKLFLGDVVITEQDRVYVVTKNPADMWIGAYYDILMVKDIQDGSNGHHKECFLRTVR